AEVLAAEPADVRRLIAVVARAGFASAQFCEQFGMAKASEILASLARRGIFVEGRGERLGWFSLSTLMRETALAELPLSEADGRAVDTAACAWLEQQGYLAEALRYCRLRSEWPAAVRILETWGTHLVNAGEVSEVLATVERLPAERSAAIHFVAGEVFYAVGDW